MNYAWWTLEVTEIVEMSLNSSAAQVHSCKNFVRWKCKQCTDLDISILFFGPLRSRAYPTASFFLPFLFQVSRRICTREYRSPYAKPCELRSLLYSRSSSSNPFTFSLRLRFFAFDVNPMIATPTITLS